MVELNFTSLILNFAIIAIAILGLFFSIKKALLKRKISTPIYGEIALSAICIIAVYFAGSVIVSGTGQENPMPQNQQNQIAEAKPFALKNFHAFAVPLSKPVKCGTIEFCFNAKITYPENGNLKTEVAEIQTNAMPHLYNEIEIFGEKTPNGIKVLSENIIPAGPVDVAE